jgi:hypothetical protein
MASRVAGWVALASVVGLALLLATRPLMEPDLGYHLEFGTSLLQTGTIIDQVPYLYTLPAPSTPAVDRPEPVPGSWYDDGGHYRFANANWLSQLVFAFVYQNLGGVGALMVLRLACVLAILLLTAATAVRLGVPRVALAPGLLLVTAVSYERFYLRPELIGFLVLAAQAWILAGGASGDANPSRRSSLGWGAVGWLVLLQAIAVNVHSFFLLGLGLTLASLVGQPGGSRRRVAFALAGQFLACLANPWGWRLALLPIQTVLYLNSQGVMRGVRPGVEPHPWASIVEAQGPFVSVTEDQRPIYAFVVLLVLALAGAVGAIRRRRWDWLLLLAGMTTTALSMRRNIAPASLIVVPVALAAILAPRAAGAAPRAQAPASARWLGVAIPAVSLAAVAWVGVSVVTQDFFDRPTSTLRFGTGLDRLKIPLGAAEWIEEHRPQGRIWADFYSSSNVRFFSGGRNPMNLLTNGWAYPPEILRESDRYSQGERSFREAVARYDPQVVVVRTAVSGPLAHQLAADEGWQLVHLEGEFALFLRRDGPNAELARTSAIHPGTLDLAAYARRLARADPIPASGLSAGAVALLTLGWIDPGIELLEHAIRLREATGKLGPSYVVEVEGAGFAHARRAESRCLPGEALAPCRADLARAEELLRIASSGSSPRPLAQRALEVVRRNLGRLQASTPLPE